MNLKIIKINVIVFILVVESHGGVIESIYDKVHNTTSGLKQDARNVWSFGKGLVVGEDGQHKEEERGLIGGMIHSVQEKVHTFKEKFWDVDDIPSDSGLLWNWWNRMKQRISRAKDFITGNSEPKHIEDVPPNEETRLITETLNSLFFENGTRKVNGNTFNEAVENLRKKLVDMRKGTTEISDNLGEGLIDVRFSKVEETQKDIKNNVVRIGNDIYDKVNENAEKLSGKTQQSIDAISDNVKYNGREGLVNVQSGYDKARDGVNALQDGVSDVIAKEKDLLDTTHQKLNNDPKSVGDGLKKSVDDMARMAYS